MSCPWVVFINCTKYFPLIILTIIYFILGQSYFSFHLKNSTSSILFFSENAYSILEVAVFVLS